MTGWTGGIIHFQKHRERDRKREGGGERRESSEAATDGRLCTIFDEVLGYASRDSRLLTFTLLIDIQCLINYRDPDLEMSMGMSWIEGI